ncbi:hypothetical protein BGZ47_008820 [Haplosporangium gracile]|nr:hypothetical protein BGZ47_008820 [Haplosporangium gracile]
MSESHKFQIKFKSLADCGQCASFLSNWIECQSIASQESPSTYLATTITTAAASTNASSQTVVQSSQDTDVAMAPPLAHLQLDHVSSNSNNLRRLDGAHPWSQHSSAGAIGISSPALYSSSPTTISVGNEELANILRSAAANNTFLPLTMATATDTSMSPPPPPQQQQRNRQERLASVKPQFASSSMPVTSNFSSMTAGPPHMTSVALSSPGRGGQSLQSSVSASLQQRDSETREGSLNNIGNNENSISTTDDLSALLNLSNAELQEDINSILHDPSFPEVLLKVDRLLRGPYSKR